MKTSQLEIVQAAREHFRRRGYAGTSMQDLADSVGLRKASLYSRFPTKERVAQEVLKLTGANAFGEPVDGKDIRRAYEAALEAFSGDLIKNRRCVALHLAYGAGEEEPELRQAARDFFAACLKTLTLMLEPGVGAKKASQLAADAIAQMEGATLWLALENDTGPMQRAVRRAVLEANESIAQHAKTTKKK